MKEGLIYQTEAGFFVAVGITNEGLIWADLKPEAPPVAA
jgi:hypothetical protein